MSRRRLETTPSWQQPWLGLALALAAVGCSGVELAVDAVSPGSGSARGGETVVVSGVGFEEGAKVTFDDSTAPLVSFRSGSELEVVTPRRLAGPAVDVTVENPGGDTAMLARGFQFEPLELSFVEAASYYVPDLSALTVSDAVVGDFDGDDRLDVLVAVVGAPSRLLRNLGAGSFDDPYAPPEPSGDGGSGGAGGDGGGSGGATPGPDPVVPEGSWVHDTATMLAEDFDGDGVLDLFLCNRSGQPSRILLGDGQGGFVERPEALALESDECRAATLADIDADGHSDLVVVGRGPRGSGQSYLRVLTRSAGSSEVEFTAAEALEPPAEAEGQACGSVQSSAPEAIGAYALSETSPSSGLGFGQASFDFTAGPGVLSFRHSLPATSAVPKAIELELRADALGTELSLQLVDASGEQFVTSLGPADSTSWQHVRSDDPELWTASGGNADGVVDLPLQSLAVQVALGTGPAVGSIGLDDVRLDVPGPGLVIVEDFERREYVLHWAETIDSATAGDLDGDDRIDVLLSSTQADAEAHLRLVLGQPAPAEGGSFGLREVLGGALGAVAEGVAATRLLDVGDDGSLDVLAVGSNGQDRLLVNDANAHFFDDTTTLLPLDHASGRHASLCDVDMDAQLDVLIANGEAVNRIYVQRGASGFLDSTPALPLTPHRSLRMLPLDADGDGDEDLFVLNEQGERSSLYVSVEPAEEN